MNRIARISTAVTVALLTLVTATGIFFSAGAQDATPPPEGFEITPGVTAEIVPPVEDPPSLYRLQFAPDVTYAFTDDPTLGVVYVESGTLTLRLDTAVTVAQVGATDEEGESIAAGAEFTVTAGDYLALPPFTSGEVNNEGPEVGTIVVAGFIPEGSAAPVSATPAS